MDLMITIVAGILLLVVGMILAVQVYTIFLAIICLFALIIKFYFVWPVNYLLSGIKRILEQYVGFQKQKYVLVVNGRRYKKSPSLKVKT